MTLYPDDYDIVMHDPEVYSNLVKTFRESDSFYRYLWTYNEQRFYTEFRLWLVRKYKCYNSGTGLLYFKTQADYIWFRLKL